MGRTLFWYVFRDLLKIFFMTSGALAGIMSFGGLLRPLTQQGLDPGQVSKMLAYFTPAMTAYSFPIAALFAATMVYGRLSSDNELTACRAGGVSLGPFFGMAFPGLVFGLLVALISLVFLCFIVPVYTLKVEQVIYSNLAKLIANRIERTHEIRFGDFNVFATRAYLPPPETTDKDRQRVVLGEVSIVTYDRARAREDSRFKYPREFMLASAATIEIVEREDDQVDLLFGLEEGTKFPREFRGGSQAGISTSQFGPIEMPSPIKEDTKFMKVDLLRRLYHHPEESRRIKAVIAGFIKHDQILAYLTQVRGGLNPADNEGRPAGARRFAFDGERGRVTVTINEARTATVANPKTGRPELRWQAEAVHEGPAGEELVVHGGDATAVRFEREGDQPTVQTARDLKVRVRPDTPNRKLYVTIELLERSPRPGGRPVSGNYSEVITVPMSADLARLQARHVSHYESESAVGAGELSRFRREQMFLKNAILSEVNGRASFGVSCLILVMVGSALGMMFRSGNFLTAFAVSFVPALVCITLIISGQQTCHAIPWTNFERHNPLRMGLSLIWSGNIINFVIAVWLLWKLQRQ